MKNINQYISDVVGNIYPGVEPISVKFDLSLNSKGYVVDGGTSKISFTVVVQKRVVK